jgi:hypothetical protein
LRGGGDDNDDDGGSPPPPHITNAELFYLVREYTRAAYDRSVYRLSGPVKWAFSDAWPSQTVASAIHRTIPDVCGAIIQTPETESLFDDLCRWLVQYRGAAAEATNTLTHRDNEAILDIARALGATPEHRSRERVQLLHRALQHVLGRFTQAEAAEVVAHLTRRLTFGEGRNPDERASIDAASARLQILAEQFPALSPEQQQAIAATVAALANKTTRRQLDLRRAIRHLFDSSLALDDLVQVCKWGIGLLARRPATRSAIGE